MAMQKEDFELGKRNEEGYCCPCGHGAKVTGSTQGAGDVQAQYSLEEKVKEQNYLRLENNDSDSFLKLYNSVHYIFICKYTHIHYTRVYIYYFFVGGWKYDGRLRKEEIKISAKSK